MDLQPFLADPIRELDVAAHDLQDHLASIPTTADDRAAIFALLPSLRKVLVALDPRLENVVGFYPNGRDAAVIEAFHSNSADANILPQLSEAVERDIKRRQAAK